MKCSPSKISRIESGTDHNLDWEELTGYVHALGLQINISFSDNSLPVDTRIKQHVLKIHKLLENLADLAMEAKENKALIEIIHHFYGEVLMTFLAKFKDYPEENINLDLKY